MTDDTVPCADPDNDHNWWFADGSTPEGQADTELAIALCNSCPIRYACLAQAMVDEDNATSRYRHGVYGGLTNEDRARLYRGGRIQTTRPSKTEPTPLPPPATPATLELKAAA